MDGALTGGTLGGCSVSGFGVGFSLVSTDGETVSVAGAFGLDVESAGGVIPSLAPVGCWGVSAEGSFAGFDSAAWPGDGSTF